LACCLLQIAKLDKKPELQKLKAVFFYAQCDFVLFYDIIG